ncbi:hypothetical protein GPALN_011917 [Globodera pallida]|nr:hypothetical protein GPALN_011917 [Globodera pallida]
MFTKYRIILLVFITVLLWPLNDVYGMEGTSNFNYGNKSKSTVVYDEQNTNNPKNELFVLFKGFVEIRKDDEATLRPAKENEVFMEIFCGEKLFCDDISTDRFGKFEVLIPTSNVEGFEECKKGINIGFYRKDPSKSRNFLRTIVRNPLDAEVERVQRIFAKVHSFNCLILSKPLTENDVTKIENQKEKEKKENLSKYLNKQYTKHDDENSFQIGFNPKYAKINGTEAQILGDKEQYKYIVYKKYFKKDSVEPETSSSDNQLVNKFATLLGKKKTKPTHF